MQVLTHFPILKALGWALFNSLWQMAALWLVYSLIVAIFRPAAARVRHGLALLLLNIGALWTGITFFTAFLFPDNGNAFWLPFLSPAQSAGGWLWQTSRVFMDTVMTYGSTLYLLILSGLLIRYSGHYWHTRKITRKGLTTMPAEFRVFVDATALQLNIGKPVKAWLSSLIDVPLTLGFLKPVILLPAAMISQLTTQQVEAILIHELGHIQRKDYLLHLIVTLLEGLFFFNPFCRLLIRQLTKEREHCCDDLVLQFKYDAHAYVSALLSLATRQKPAHQLAVAATGSSDKLLLQRARRILLRQEGGRSRPGFRTLALVIFTGVITTLALHRPLLPAHRAQQGVARSSAQSGVIPASLPASVPASFPASAPASIPAATPRETSFDQPIHSTPPPAVTHPRQAMLRPRTRVSHETVVLQTGDEDIFVKTSDDALIDDGGTAAIAATGNLADQDNGATAPTARDYSLNMSAAPSGPNIAIRQGTPIVPNSSFSFQYTLGDSAQSAAQLFYLQQSAEREVLAAIAMLQQQTARQLKALSDLQKAATTSVRLRHQIQVQQQELQQEYLRKIGSWQKKLETTPRIRMIVYI